MPRLADLRHLLATQRFLRFLLVGGLNTAFGYAVFCGALLVMPTAFLALCLSTTIGIAFNFMSTGRLVFGSLDVWRLVPFVGVYVVVFAYNALGLAILQQAGIGPRIAGLLLLPGAVAIGYVLNRSFVFATKA